MAEIVLVHGIDQQQKSADCSKANGYPLWLVGSVPRASRPSRTVFGAALAIPPA
jgi:hypothetical protein